MDNFVQNVYQKFLNEVSAAPELKNLGVKNPLLIRDLVRSCIGELKDHFKAEPFKDMLREIQFFKYEKPRIIAEHIFTQELYAIESNKPVGDRALTNNYYTQELTFLKRVFDQNRYLYQYFQLDGVEFDQQYFSRGNKVPEINLPIAPDIDPEFSTQGDFLFAKFIAYERLQDHLINLLYSPGQTAKPEMGHDMRWTGDVINLVELIYGLNLTGQVNHGNVSLNEMVRWAENLFDVKIGIIQRRFAEIQSRKRIASTRFLDQMRESVHQKIEDQFA
ncbi:RteC domain-containing protein [Mucilaginibacter sp.]|jgi:hypothetical protein|uniref:RteC domain-containing protein n=1 Tax=Mucilaginibacter sp. TaxID=1882438 RepID=UPI002CD9EE9C|nr:RteC domain-containing protein [Mucilaginibacter sp.]HTI58999.1 RteC domain-containing protein [Mucilaginibacter sp.]